MVAYLTAEDCRQRDDAGNCQQRAGDEVKSKRTKTGVILRPRRFPLEIVVQEAHISVLPKSTNDYEHEIE